MTEEHRRGPYQLVPGFSQTADSWNGVIDALPPGSRAITLEVPGGSGFVETAHALSNGRTGIWGGYSLGGRLALQIALDRPAHVKGLVLVSTTAGIVDGGERRQRRADDEALAGWIEAHGMEAFLTRWLAQPMFAGLDSALARRHRLESAATVADQLRALGQGAQQPLWDRLSELKMPVVLVAGERDAKYAAFAWEMAAAIGPTAELHLAPRAGHALLQERPRLIAELLATI